VAAAVIIIALFVVLVPGTRRAVADLLEEAGVRIGFITETPTIDPGSLILGDEMTLDDARDLVGFQVVVPESLGGPDAVFVGEDLSVSMVWFDDPVVLTQRSAGSDFAEKGLGPETVATSVAVNDVPALWITGAPHTFTLLDRDGNPLEESTRLAQNVLLWTSDGVDYRLETTSNLDRAIAISETMEVD
jgi:hypothetical protein